MPFGPAGRLLFALLGTDAAWKVLEKAIDTIPKVLKPPPAPIGGGDEESRKGHQQLEAEIRKQAESLARLGATMEELAKGLRPLVVKVTVALWMSMAAALASIIALILALRG